jgi:hypothetical protein
MVRGCSQAFAVQHPARLPGFLDHPLVGYVHAGHRVVVVELHRLETQLLVQLQLLGELDRLAYRGPEHVGPLVDVPGPEGKTELSFAGHALPPF